MQSTSNFAMNLEAPKTDADLADHTHANRAEYDIFLKVNNAKVKESIELSEDATIDYVINTIIGLHRELFRGENPNNYELYIAKKDGEPKDDYPAMDRSQRISLAKVKRFVVVKRPQEQSLRMQPELEEVESYCFCFTRPKRIVRN